MFENVLFFEHMHYRGKTNWVIPELGKQTGFYFKTWQYRSKTNWVIPKLGNSEAKQTGFNSKLGNMKAKQT
jgi:hypothetical protein